MGPTLAHKDSINWEDFIPQETEELEKELNTKAKQGCRCRGCGKKWEAPPARKAKLRIWCVECKNRVNKTRMKLGYDRDKWIDLIFRQCCICGDNQVRYPLKTGNKTCSDECLVEYTANRARQWQIDNYESIYNTSMEYRIRNHDRIMERQREYRERRKEAGIDPGLDRKRPHAWHNRARGDKTSTVFIKRLLARQGGLCGISKLPLSPEHPWAVDHIFPICKGGTTDDSNLQLTYRIANNIKSSKLEAELTIEDYIWIHKRIYALFDNQEELVNAST